MKPKKKALEMLIKMGSGSGKAKGAAGVSRTQKRTPGKTRVKKEQQLEMPFTDEDFPILGSKVKPDKTKENVDILQGFLDTIGGKKKLSSAQESAYDQMMQRVFKD